MKGVVMTLLIIAGLAFVVLLLFAMLKVASDDDDLFGRDE